MTAPLLRVTRRTCVSISSTSSMMTSMLRCLRRMERMGCAMSPGESTGERDLVQQRLKGVVVLTVDDGDVEVKLAEVLRGGDAGEASPDDHHARPDSLCSADGHDLLSLQHLDSRFAG